MAYDLITQNMEGGALRSALNAVIADYDLFEQRRTWDGKKLVVFGDSIWGLGIETEIERLLGCAHDPVERVTGKDGRFPTAIAGRGIGSPSTQGGTNSMYETAGDMAYYEPDLIVIEGGINDTIGGTMGPDTYTHTDAPLTGSDLSGASYVSCLKGMFLKLITGSPAATIVFTGRWVYETSEPSADNMARIMARRDADEYCCRWAGVRYIDSLMLGVSHLNATTMFSGSAHPSATGALVIARAFAKAATFV